MNYKHITVAGSGVLGSQTAYQTAYKGFCVNVYDISNDVLGHTKERLAKLKGKLQRRFRRNAARPMRRSLKKIVVIGTGCMGGADSNATKM
jgi:3-hydroxyacyl-CoA dehydrogenase